MPNELLQLTDLSDYNEGIGREVSALRGFADLLDMAAEANQVVDGKALANFAMLADALVSRLEARMAEIEHAPGREVVR